jgi:Skp family chaperone for outer membrane proteins
MKKLSLLMIVLLSFSMIKAQSNREKIESYRVAYFTQKLSLTSEEAQRFWPIYNEYRGKLDEIRRQKRDELSKAKGNQNLSDAEKEAMIDHQIEYKQQELNLQKIYTEKFKQALPIDKVSKLFYVEESFKKELIDRVRHQPAPKQGR